MRTYWYFAATLPGFLFGSPPPLTIGDFLERCERSIDADDFALVKELLDSAQKGDTPLGSGNAFLEAFASWERGFKNELCRLRARRALSDSERFIRLGASAEAAQAAMSVFSIADPYQSEIAFEKERWNAVERFSALASFDSNAILAYTVKLAIASRLAAFERERGLAAYAGMYKAVMQGNSASGEDEVFASDATRGATR